MSEFVFCLCPKFFDHILYGILKKVTKVPRYPVYTILLLSPHNKLFLSSGGVFNIRAKKIHLAGTFGCLMLPGIRLITIVYYKDTQFAQAQPNF